MIKPKILSDDEISERWHIKEHSNSNDGSWHYRLGALRWIAQAQNDYCYKEMLGQIREWGFSACPHEPSNLQARKAFCPECWQELLSQLEEE